MAVRYERHAHALTAGERLALLCDAGSLQPIRTAVESRRLGGRGDAGDGVVGAMGKVGGRPIVCYAQDGRHLGGSLGEAHADTIVRVLRLAGAARVPVVSFIESAGARMQEATAALAGYGRIFCENVALSGRVPQISIVSGTSAGGGSYSPALTDFVVMVGTATMFLTGPAVVRAVLGEDADAASLGGSRVHERNGVCQFHADDVEESVWLVRELLSYLPQNAWEPVPSAPVEPPPVDNPGAAVPPDTRRVYDVREVVRALTDGGRLIEVAPRWARNMVTGFARLEGESIGIVANQPRHLGGVIDAAAAQKAARFVRTCNAFGLPLVVLVDTPGFMPGMHQEREGVIRHGAKLLHAFAEATVPKLSVVLRQAYGGAYITMNARDLGADLTFAWPTARIGIMGASQAVAIAHRREIEAAVDPGALRADLAEEYAAAHQHASAVAREGFVDEVIEARDTRARLCFALALLRNKPGSRGAARNIPL